jgi:hypothetical protein
MNSQLATIHQVLYVPEYNPETDTYQDVPPFEPRERQTRRYICRCKVGSSFGTLSQYKAHIKTQTHQHLIHNYKTYYKDTQQYEHQVKALTKANELLLRKVTRIAHQNKHLTDQVGQLREECELKENYMNHWGEGEETFHECDDKSKDL